MCLKKKSKNKDALCPRFGEIVFKKEAGYYLGL